MYVCRFTVEVYKLKGKGREFVANPQIFNLPLEILLKCVSGAAENLKCLILRS